MAEEVHEHDVDDDEIGGGALEPSIHTPKGALVRTPAGFMQKWDAATAMARVEHRIKAAEMVWKAAAARLVPSDFVRTGKTMYLQAKGANRLKPVVGICYPDLQGEPSVVITPHKNDPDNFTVTIAGWLGSNTLDLFDWVVGSRSSSEGFFDKFDDAGRRLPVPESLVIKSAWSNFFSRGISQLVGLQGMTPDEVRDKLGIDIDKSPAVSYSSGGKGGKQGGAQGAPDKFGPPDDRGKPWSEVSDNGLAYYKKAAEQNLQDPSKKQYHATEKARLEAINLELSKREGGE